MELVDGVVTSAEVGTAKPDRRVFERALVIAGVPASAALHVGDKVDNDVEGARAAGVRAVLLQREGDPPPGVEAVRSLRELAALL
jgi:putative hydrolase of the HAD superfamily